MERPNIRVVVFSSHVARGAVGNRAIVFALETLGIPVWAVPTIQLPWHPGHGKATRIVADNAAFASLVHDLERQLDPRNPVAVLSGYLGDAAQAEPIARFVATARRRGALATYMCDPVLGDHGGLYVPNAVASAIRHDLLPLADIATPNRFELGWLTDAGEAETVTQTIAQAHQLGPAAVLATSAPSMMAGSLGNIHVTTNAVHNAEHRVITSVPHGTGDLLAALFLAHTLLGRTSNQALGLTTAAVYAMARRAADANAPDFQLAHDRDLLFKQTGMAVRQIMTVKQG
ncbi:MAG: pyridoxal kinase [Pseudomonadota bacterium]